MLHVPPQFKLDQKACTAVGGSGLYDLPQQVPHPAAAADISDGTTATGTGAAAGTAKTARRMLVSPYLRAGFTTNCGAAGTSTGAAVITGDTAAMVAGE